MKNKTQQEKLLKFGISSLALGIFPLIWFLSQAILFRELTEQLTRNIVVLIAIPFGSLFIFLLFYGMNKDGKWLTSAAVGKKLVPGGKLAPHEVFMTVIEHGALNLVASVPEAKLANLKEGIDTHITPVSNPTLNLRGKVQRVSRVPGAYRLTASVDSDNHNLLPGMAAKLKINVANYDKAITVPNNLINGDTVKVLLNGEKIDKKIKKGPSDGKVTVILEGISEGEKIVAQ